MVQSKARTVDAYLEELPEDRRRTVACIRDIARRTLTGFEERMEYGMPFYRRSETEGVAFANQVQYISVYVGEQVIAQHRAQLNRLNVGRSCVRFGHVDQVDFKLVESMFRAAAR